MTAIFTDQFGRVWTREHIDDAIVLLSACACNERNETTLKNVCQRLSVRRTPGYFLAIEALAWVIADGMKLVHSFMTPTEQYAEAEARLRTGWMIP